METQRKPDSADQPLVDIREVQIDATLSPEEKICSFIEQIKNPYRFKVGDVVVNISYSGSEETLNDRFTEMMSLLA